MDKIAKGMSEAGKHPQQCCNKGDSSEGLLHRMAHSLKGAATRVGHVLSGRHGMPSRQAR